MGHSFFLQRKGCAWKQIVNTYHLHDEMQGLLLPHSSCSYSKFSRLHYNSLSVPPPSSPVKQTFWDVPLIIAFSDAQLPRGPAVTADGTMVNKLSVKCKHSGVHVVCVSPTHAQISHRRACTQRPKHLAGQLKVHTQTLSHKHDSYIHTRACRLWVSQPQLAMSGDAGWLITLGADGHTREREAYEENGPLCLSASVCHFLPLYLTLSLTIVSPLLVSVDPYVCPSVVCLIYEWLSQAYCSGKVSTWPALMTFSFSVYSKCFLSSADRQSRSVQLNLKCLRPHNTHIYTPLNMHQ